MPITKKETFTLRDAARETRIWDNEFLKWFERPSEEGPMGPPLGSRDATWDYSLRDINNYCYHDKLDQTIIGFPPYPIDPYEVYVPSLRSYRNYNRVNGMYAYNWTDMYVPYTDTTRDTLVYKSWLGHWSLPFDDSPKYTDRIYITLPGFKGWHIPTKGELDATIASYGGYSTAGYYLKKGKINDAYDDQWDDGNWKSPNNALQGRRLGFLPSGTLNANGDIRNMRGRKSYHPYVLFDQQNHLNWDLLLGEEITGIHIKNYEDMNGEEHVIDGKKVQTKSNYVFSMEDSKITVETGRLTQRAQTVRLVRDQSNTATSFIDVEGNEYGTYTVNGVTWMDRDVCCSYEAIYNDCKEMPVNRASFKTLQPARYSDLVYANSIPHWPWKPSTEDTVQYGYYDYGQSGGRFPEINMHSKFDYPTFVKVISRDRVIFRDSFKYILATTPGYRVIPFYVNI